MSQIKFSVSSDRVDVVNYDPNALQNDIPPAIYTIRASMFGLYLYRHANLFDVPEQLFGSLQSRVNLLVDRYKKTGSISALLTGEKGAGKSLLSSVFGNRFITDLKKPVILVNNTFDDINGLKSFLHSLGDACFIFDEFAKVFGDKQDGMLDFFSGALDSNRAVFVIDNEAHKISTFIRNRPGRLLYHFAYGKLEMAVVADVCKYHNLDKRISEYVMDYAAKSYDLTMDTLSRIVEECVFSAETLTNEEDFLDLIEILNVPDVVNDLRKITAIKLHGKNIKFKDLNYSLNSNNMCFYVNINDLGDFGEAIVSEPWFMKLVENQCSENDPVVEMFIPRKFCMDTYDVFSDESYGDLAIQVSYEYGGLDKSYRAFK